MKIQFLNVSKTGPPPNTESKNQNKQDNITWSRPKKSIKPTFPPTWEKTTTENRFESLSYLSDDEQITQEGHAASLDIQMQNIKLQHQVQFLQKRVAESRPSNENTKSIVKDSEKRPITTKPADNNKTTKRKNEIGAK